VAKISDFGLAITVVTLQESLSAVGGSAGSLPWKAPETFAGKYSNKSDVFSFGILGFEVVSRRVPYEDLEFPEITKLVTKSFEFNEAFVEYGLDEEKQRDMWRRQNPLDTRRPDLALAEAGCASSLLDCISECWADQAADRPNISTIVSSLKLLDEGRPYWGRGGSEQVLILPEGREMEDVVAAFKATLTAYQIDVRSVERVQSPELWDSFAAKKRSMLSRPGASVGAYERMLFHGTDESTVPKIVAQGV